MIKRFFSLGLMILMTAIVSPTSMMAQGVQRQVVKTWDFNWSDATKENLYFATYWRVKSNVYYHEYALSDAAFTINGNDKFPGLKFTAAKSQLAYRSEGLYINKDNSATMITLPTLSQGNIIVITSKGGTAGQYLTPTVELSDDGIQVLLGNAPDETTTNFQTYKYDIKATDGGTYSLKAKLSGSSLTSIATIEVYASSAENADKLYEWDFTTMLTSDQLAKIPTETVEWSFGSNRYYKGFGSDATPSTNGTAIAEISDMKFTTTASTQIRLVVGSTPAIFLVKNTGAYVTIPIAKANSKVTIVASQAGIADAAASYAITPETADNGKTSTFIIPSAGSFSFKNGNNDSGDINVTSITVEGPEYAIVNGGSPENGNLAFTSEGNAVANVTNGFYSGSTVTINATPAEGYVLESLSGTYYQDAEHPAEALTIENNTFTMPSTGNVTITATFKKIQYKLTKSVSNGSLTLKYTNADGEDINTGESGIDLDWGTTIYVSASPSSEDYYLSSLTYGETPMENNSTFSMPSSATEVTATFTAKNTPSVTKVENFTYDGQSHDLVTTTPYDATLSYAYKVGDGDFSDWSETIPSATNAGTYTVKWKATGGPQSKSVEETTLDAVAISKATPTITTAPTASAITEGQTLESSTLTGGVASVEGTFAWTTPTITPSVSDSETTDYSVTFTPTDKINYNTATTNVKLTVNEPTPVNHMLTLQQPATGGSITTDNSGELAAETEIKLTATPNAGYQLKSWKSGDETYGSLPKSLIQTISMPNSDLTITAEFEAQPASIPGVSESTLWTFDDFAEGTILSHKNTPYCYNGLYISGHNDNQDRVTVMTYVKKGKTSTTIDNATVSVERCLYLAGGNTTSYSDQDVNAFAQDRVAFHAGSAGTLYVYMSGTKDANRKFIIEANGTQNKTAMSGENTSPVLLTQDINAGSNVYIGVSTGSAQIYAIKFVPASYTFKATTGSNGSITVMKGETNVTEAVAAENGATYSYGTTLVLTPTPTDAETHEFDKWTTDGTTELATGDDISIDATTHVLTVNLKSDLTVQATFKEKTTPTPYTVTGVPDDGNGNKVEASPTSAAAGAMITLTITTATNYTLNSISAKDSNEGNVELTGEGNTRTFTMPASNVTVTATFAGSSKTNISGATVTLSKSSFICNGSEQAPSVTEVRLGETVLAQGTDYIVNTIESKTNVGTYTVTVTGTGNYTGEATANWKIKRDLGVTLNGTLQWATYFAAENLEVPVGVTVYKVTGVSGTTVSVEAVDYIKANTGVLLYGETAIAPANLIVGAGSGDDYTSELLGSVEEGTMTSGTNYVLYNNQFILAENTELPANRCYIHLSGSAASRGLTIVPGNGNTTGIEDIPKDEGEQTKDQYYNMNGQRIDKPTKKGLYIVNGRKVVIK